MNSLYGKVSYGADSFNNYSNNKYLSGSKEFLESNSIVAKISFLIIVLFIFIIILRLGITILSYIFTHPDNPILINGMVDGEQLIVKYQDPSMPNSMPIMRSVNRNDGLEFTWSTWIWIKNPSSNSTSNNNYKHIFSKGSDIIDSKGVAIPNNAPGLYLSNTFKELMVVMNTYENIDERITISDIPIEKWINIIIRVDQKQLDVFINGTMTRSKTLSTLPAQNYDNVYIAMNGGFPGNLSSLRYFSKAIGTNKIQSIVEKGPNLTPISTSMTKSLPYYLSFRWFFPEDYYSSTYQAN